MFGTPLTLDELTAALARIGGFEPRPLIAVATSGGPDSLALAILADRWARGRGGVAWAVTVDHRLRPESGGEARLVGCWLAAREIPHAILAWDGPKPGAGLQAAAREARYRLLGEWCRSRGCLHLLTAHQRGDQAETYLIRRRAKSGPDGLAAMATVREMAGYRLVRPLLAVPRARLAAFLAAEGQEAIDDPSNRNPAFERARLRGVPVDEVVFAEIARHGRARIAREHAVDRLIARHVILHPAGFALIDPAPILAAESGLAERLFGRLAMTIGGAAYPPRRERLARLRDGLGAVPDRARTLGGCRYVPWRNRVIVMREPAAPAPLDLGISENLVWDRRFAVSGTAPGLILACLGRDGVAAVDRDARRGHAPDLPPLVHPSLPALRDGQGRVVAVPHLDWRGAGAGALPGVYFRPVAPLTRAAFTVV
ncbi:MAG TPA: tRNA lysidine(34) synthetase TilS [Stellaceae bacterium]|jgi:tRNA(Ile)-lysidine synthase|nr:tRNA lysidine(34) synthetase TilS [Stellaceae bacterium]